MPHVSIALVGFGNVGRALARLLLRKQALLKSEYGITFQITGIATGSHGTAIDLSGIDLERALSVYENGQSLQTLSTRPATKGAGIVDFIRTCPADVLFENSPVNHTTGQPAIDHLKAALECGMHAITANKGPVVHGLAELKALALQKKRRFLFESTVMDGAPIFSLFRGPLPGVELRGFTGILNSTTNLILELMENGRTFDQAVEYTQQAGLAETDPSNDIDGWDAAIKVAALSTVVMNSPLKPQEVDRTGIRGITPELIAEARAAGERWKLVCSAHWEIDHVVGTVAPRRVAAGSPLYSISGSSSYVQFETDVLPGLGIVESNPSPETTAYGLLADMVNALRNG
jgi:homoserine dehydrogenase